MAGRVQQDVLRLDIAMDDAARMGILKRGTHLPEHVQRFLNVQRAGLHSLAERHAIDVFHGDEVEAGLTTDIVDAYDIRLIERSQSLTFTLEPGREVRLGSQLRR